MTQRVQWLDAAKGLGILAVVAYHCLEGMLNSFPEQAGLRPFADFFRNWAMQMFFLASGIVARHGILNSDAAASRRRIFDWVYIYLLWSVIIYVTRLASGSFTNTSMDAHEILHIAWDPVPTIWFIYALLLCYVLTTLLRNANSLAVIGAALAANIANDHFGWTADLIFPRLCWVYVFYAIGFFHGGWIVEKVEGSRWHLAWIALFAVVGVAAALAKSDIPPLLGPLISLLLVFGYFKLCDLVVSRASPWLAAGLCHFGVISLYIYLTHFPLPAFVRIALLKLGLYNHLLAVVLAVVAAAVTGHIASRLARRDGFRWLFQRPRSGRRPAGSSVGST